MVSTDIFSPLNFTDLAATAPQILALPEFAFSEKILLGKENHLFTRRVCLE
jgi:hypothetical protein